MSVWEKICLREMTKREVLFKKADEALGFSLSTICFEGPEEELKQTKNTQPAIFLHSIVLFHLLQDKQFDMAAGHSLGEYSALVAAGALTFEDGLTLVRLRGELMQQAGAEHPGTMAALVGLDAETVGGLCEEASAAGIVPAGEFQFTWANSCFRFLRGRTESDGESKNARCKGGQRTSGQRCVPFSIDGIGTNGIAGSVGQG